MSTEQSDGSPGTERTTGTQDPWIGSTVDGRYAIEDRLARGGMSTVYLARDQRLGRQVALKVLFPHMAEDHKVVERFEQEARNSALISHPNVVQVLDQGQTRETAYLVMEYVPGATLRTLLKRGPMTPRLTLTYMDAILQGLAAAHRAGLVHRDIKPENVLVSQDGRIKLTDFGLARAATHHSGTSTLMGTVAYISPELLSGEGADERADVYAVGILFYEMLTGHQPYTGDSPVRVAFQHVNSTVPAPSDSMAGLAEPLDELVHAATSSKAADRPVDAAALLERVRRIREELTAEQLDVDVTAAGARPGVPAGGSAPTAPVDETLVAEGPDVDGGGSGAEDGGADPTVRTADPRSPANAEEPAWDQDIDAALEHARTTTLDEADRQTVAEVPTEAFRAAVDHDAEPYSPPDETTEFSAVGTARPQPGQQGHDEHGEADGARPGRSLRPLRGRSTAAKESVKRRQRPRVDLEGPTPTRAWITVAIVMIASALIVLFAWYLGLSPEIIPSLGGADTLPAEGSAPT